MIGPVHTLDGGGRGDSLRGQLPSGAEGADGAAHQIARSDVSDEAEKIFDQHDSPKIVIDEVLGMAATMFGNPLSFPYLMLGFLLFRIADVIKPWPASVIDRRMRNGAGVMLDDLAAAIYANIVLQVIARVL